MTIGTLAERAGVNVETIRYYQRRGLLAEPARPRGSVRRYAGKDLERLTFVKTAQRLGFALDEIGELLKLEDGTHCSEARALAEHKLSEVRDKLASLHRIERALSGLIRDCEAYDDDVACPMIRSLQQGVADTADEKL